MREEKKNRTYGTFSTLAISAGALVRRHRVVTSPGSHFPCQKGSELEN